MIEHIEILVEEPSAEAALQCLLPKIIGTTSHTIHVHQGKTDLLQRLPERLKGYVKWLPSTWRLLVIVDRDDDDCALLKSQLEDMSAAAGLLTRTAGGGTYRMVNRIAIEELEAWFFGDWRAVKQAYPRVKSGVPTQQAYRDPDGIKGGTWEALERVLQGAGYFSGGLPKIAAARAIASHMNPARNTSPSFRALRDVLLEMAAE